MAAEHGWTPRRIEHELTDEHLILLLDEAIDRQSARAQGEFDRMVEAVRAGTIFAHDGKQYSRWLRSRRHEAGRVSAALTGAALELHIATLRLGRPDLVHQASA